MKLKVKKKKILSTFIYLTAIISLFGSVSADVGDICPSGLEINGGQCATYESIRENLNFCGLSDVNETHNPNNFGIEISFVGNTECVRISDINKYAYGPESTCPSGYGVKNINTQKVGCLNPHQAAATNYLLENGDLPPGVLTAGTVPDPTEPISLGLAERVTNTYAWALGISGMLALGIIIFGGVLYSASGGNPGRIDEAKKWIQHALFGLALLFSSYLLLNLINPDLTRLQEIFLDPNPQIQGPTLERRPGAGKLFGKCVKGKPTEHPTPNYGGSTCGGFYTGTSAPVGNFGDDPICNRPDLGLASFKASLKSAMKQELRATGAFCETNVNRLTRIMIDMVVVGESGYNPNAFATCSSSGHGAFGLFQMNPVDPRNPNSISSSIDRGDVPWREQVRSAAYKLAEGPRGHLYWEQWPGREEGNPLPKEIDCGGGNNDELEFR